MLTRNCEKNLGYLLKASDYNVRTTIAFYAETEGSWKEHIRDSIGGGIINSYATYSLCCHYVKDSTVSKICQKKVVGNNLIESIWKVIKDSEAVRIDISNIKNPNLSKTWIVAKNNV